MRSVKSTLGIRGQAGEVVSKAGHSASELPGRSLGENHTIKRRSQEISMPQQMGMKEMNMSNEMRMSNGHGGHLYTQTNEIRNAIIRYRRDANGALTEVERIPTGGAGSGTFKPISGQESAPNAFEGAGSVILTPDRRLLFATNGGDNSVSSFRVGEDGRLTLLDYKPTGNPVEGRSGTAKSLAYAPSSGTLVV